MIIMCWLYEMFGMRPEECFSYVAKLFERMKIFQVANYGYIFDSHESPFEPRLDGCVAIGYRVD